MNTFHPVIQLPSRYEVLDLRAHLPEAEVERHRYAVGRYDEKRRGTYTSEIFVPKAGPARDVHMGIDLFAPVGEPVHAFAESEVHAFGYNPAQGDYGNVIITRTRIGRAWLYALHGHLSSRSLERMAKGRQLAAGEAFAWVGDRHENGGWVPHLHFQLSYEEPEGHDLPGVVADEDRALALLKYPDPRLVLGPIY